MSGYLIAVVVYLWAGYWMARPLTRMRNLQDEPAWVGGIAYVVSLLGWGVLFPIMQVRMEQQSKEGASQ